MREIADAYASIPADHLGLLIGLTAVIGGLILAGIGIWRGGNLQCRQLEVRVQLITEMMNAGYSSSEIVSVLDHSSLGGMNDAQNARLVQDRVRMAKKPAKFEVPQPR